MIDCPKRGPTDLSGLNTATSRSQEVYTSPANCNAMTNLTDQQRQCAAALNLEPSTIRVRLHRGWEPWEAVATPARERNPNGYHEPRVRYGMPRCWWELCQSVSRRVGRQRQTDAARAMLRRQGLLPADVDLPTQRPRKSPWAQRPIRQSMFADVLTEEFHRPV